MRLLHLIYDHPDNPWVGGGGAIRAVEVCKGLAARGHDITLACGAFPGCRDQTADGIEYRFLGSPAGYKRSTFSYAFRAAALLIRESRAYDVVVEEFAPWNPVMSFALSKPPAILHVNHREGMNIIRRHSLPGLPFFLIEALYPRMFRHVTALSEATREKIKVPGAFVLPAGISESALATDPVPADEREPFVLYLGRLEVYNKGLDTLMAAMREVKGVKLVLAGRGRDETILREMAEGLDVEFRGFVSEEEKTALLDTAAAFVLPSRFEGWGIVVLEAAARGTPVVVSDIPELGYAVDGGYGLRFKVGDAGSLAAQLSRLTGDGALRKSLGLRARQEAALYTWERITGEFVGFLRGIGIEA